MALQNLAEELSDIFLIFELNEFLNSDLHKLDLENFDKSIEPLNKVVFLYMTLPEYDKIESYNLPKSSYLFPWILCEPVIPNLFFILTQCHREFKNDVKWSPISGFHMQ